MVSSIIFSSNASVIKTFHEITKISFNYFLALANNYSKFKNINCEINSEIHIFTNAVQLPDARVFLKKIFDPKNDKKTFFVFFFLLSYTFHVPVKNLVKNSRKS